MGPIERINAALARLESEDPDAALLAVGELRRRLPRIEEVHVERAVRAGLNWRQIAAALGVTKQAAHKKHARRIFSTPRAAPPTDPAFVVAGCARRAVRLAREEARALGDDEVRPPHLVLGFCRDGQSVAAEALAAAGVTLETARASATPGAAASDGRAERPIRIAPETRAVFEESLRDAVRRGDAHLGVEHLLRVAVRDPEGEVWSFVRSAGGDPARLARLLDEAAAISNRRPAGTSRAPDRAP